MRLKARPQNAAAKAFSQASDQAVEQHDIDVLALANIGFIVPENDETICFAHRTQDARALRAGRRDMPFRWGS